MIQNILLKDLSEIGYICINRTIKIGKKYLKIQLEIMLNDDN